MLNALQITINFLSVVKESKIIVLKEAVAEKRSFQLETIAENLDLQNKAYRLTDDDLDIIRNFENHLSITKIKENLRKDYECFFSVTRDEVKEVIKDN